MIGVCWTDSLVKGVYHALLFVMVNDTEDVMGDFLWSLAALFLPIMEFDLIADDQR